MTRRNLFARNRRPATLASSEDALVLQSCRSGPRAGQSRFSGDLRTLRLPAFDNDHDQSTVQGLSEGVPRRTQRPGDSGAIDRALGALRAGWQRLWNTRRPRNEKLLTYDPALDGEVTDSRLCRARERIQPSVVFRRCRLGRKTATKSPGGSLDPVDADENGSLGHRW